MNIISLLLLCVVIFEIRTIKSQTIIGLPGDDNSDNDCGSVAKLVSEADKNTKLLSHSFIVGKWVSEECESRSGPKFVLRSYTFYPNGTFQLVQFYYNDESCSSVSYTVTMEGWYKLKQRRLSFSQATYTKIAKDLRKVTVVAHDIRTASDFAITLNQHCPGLTDRYWKPFVEYVILWKTKTTSPGGNPTSTYESWPNENSNSSQTSDRRPKKEKNIFRCLASVNLSLNELDEVRIQSRYTEENGFKYELLLANIYYTDQRLKVLHDKFQLPLTLVNKSSNCLICDSVAESTNMHVRPLPAKAKLPLYMNGEWTSKRCEVLSTGLFSKRTLRLHWLSHKWELQTSYYSDFICSNVIMVHHAFGNYCEDNVSPKRVPGAVDLTFSIEKSYLTILEESVLHSILSDIPQYWQMGVTSEIPSRVDCASVGVVYASKRYDIARLDIDDRGIYLLYLGDEGSSIRGRPTAYKYPLLRCSAYIDEEQLFNLHSSDMSVMLPTPSFILLLASSFHVLFIILQ